VRHLQWVWFQWRSSLSFFVRPQIWLSTFYQFHTGRTPFDVPQQLVAQEIYRPVNCFRAHFFFGGELSSGYPLSASEFFRYSMDAP
jgi:hypothetical protein